MKIFVLEMKRHTVGMNVKLFWVSQHLSINISLPAHLILITFIAQVFDQAQHALCCGTFPVGPGVWTQRLIPGHRRRRRSRLGRNRKKRKCALEVLSEKSNLICI